MQPLQERLYRGALKDLILDLKATDERTFRRRLTSFLARRNALLQICSNPAAVAEGYTETPAKLLALEDLLEQAILHRGEKIILWSFYTASIDAIVTKFARYNPVRYDGTVTDVADRRESIRRFQEDDQTMLFVGNPAAAGAGLTLHRARLAIYESMSNQPAHYLQSLDRIHRRGQTREVEYMVLLSPYLDRAVAIFRVARG
jgi:SNF2 family DNA or RNA helicase